MRRLFALCCLVLAPLLTASGARATASGPEDDRPTQGELLGVDAKGQTAPCPLEHTDVKAVVSGFLARVDVTQRFVNPLDERIEAVYLFPLPHGAAVDGMTMRVGDRTIQGQIMKREEARTVYETARSAGHLASLLDQERPNVFTQSVANILPGETVEIVISYVEPLPFEDGSYRFVFPMVVGPRYIPAAREGGSSGVQDAERIQAPALPPGSRSGHDVSIEVEIDAGLPVEGVRSKSHQIATEQKSASEVAVRLADSAAIPNKDFELAIDVSGAKIQDGVLTHRSGEDGFFALVLQPPDRVAPEDATPKEIVFLLDTSSSMSGFPLEKARETVRLALDGLNPEDTFNLITFAGSTKVLFPEPVPATRQNLRAANNFLDSTSGGGGTEMLTAIRTALEPSDAQDHVRVVCFLTDGYIGNDFEIISEVQKHPNARVFCFGIGGSVNRYLLDGIAEEGRGEAEYVSLDDDGSAAARRFHERVRSPILTDVAIDWGGLPVKDVYPARIPDLFSAKPVVVFGRYSGAASGTVRLTGKATGVDTSREIAVELPETAAEHDVLATLWARRRVDELMREDYAGLHSGKPREGVHEAIAKLGVEFRLMTQFTSFVAVEQRRTTETGDPRRVPVASPLPEGVAVSVDKMSAIAGGAEAITATRTLSYTGASYVGEACVVAVASEPLVDASSTSLSTTVDARRIEGLPPYYLGPLNLITGKRISVACNPASDPIIVLDGKEVEGAGPAAETATPTDSIESVQTSVGGYEAELGRTPVSVVNVVTKAGNNEFHGSAFEFHRDSALAAQPFAEKAFIGGPGAPPIEEGVFARNQFGFSAGGPIVSDKAWFFGNAEWLRVRSQRNAPFLVATPELLAASDPATRAFFAGRELKSPIAGRIFDVGGIPAFGYSFAGVGADTGAGLPQNTLRGVGRVDWKIANNTSLFARAGVDRSILLPGSVSASPYVGYDTGAGIRAGSLHASVTQTISPKVVATASVSYDRTGLDRGLGERPGDPTLYLLPRADATVGDAFARVAFPGYAPLEPGAELPLRAFSTTLRTDGEASVALRNHLLKAGGFFGRAIDDRTPGHFRTPAETLGLRVSDAVENLVAGRALRYQELDSVAAPGSLRMREGALFVSDQWQATPRLTATLGLRYEAASVPRFEDGAALFEPDRNDFAPRVGLAFDLFDDDTTVARAGYGIGYTRIFDTVADTLYRGARGEVFDLYGLGSEEPLVPIRRDRIGPAAGSPADRWTPDPTLRTPIVHFWSASVEREIVEGLAASVGYSGSKGVGLLTLANVNRPLSTEPERANPLGRPDPRFADLRVLSNDGFSSSHALTAGATARDLADSGLDLTARYTWSHTIDNVRLAADPAGRPALELLDAYDARLDRGDSDLDARHRFTSSALWELPWARYGADWRNMAFGRWELSAVVEARTGLPFSAYDCSSGLSVCPRAVAAGPVIAGDATTSRRPGDMATGNRYVLADFAGRLARVDARDGGPFPAGMLGRNALRGPGAWRVDAGLFKTLAFAERVTIQFRVELLNAFNHANLFVSESETDVSATGYVPGYFDGRRQIQLGARLTF